MANLKKLAKKVEKIKAKEIKIIKDCNGNEYWKIDFDTPCEDKTRLAGTMKIKKVDGKYLMEHMTKEISLKKEDRRTLNGIMFAKII